ncbi:MAG: Exonuclease small subunit [Anaerocolumna sp.]|jgi:exodeoxyribonuclease VII small subunit|nr:Exonuclease small subunit [Anaerocolumna sp.]
MPHIVSLILVYLVADTMVENMKKEEKTLEASFLELNDIITKLEMEEISLEDSFSLYQEGMKLLKVCNDSIDKVEKQLIILGESTTGDNGEEV